MTTSRLLSSLIRTTISGTWRKSVRSIRFVYFCFCVASHLSGRRHPRDHSRDNPIGKLFMVVKRLLRSLNFCVFPEASLSPFPRTPMPSKYEFLDNFYVLHHKGYIWLHIPCIKYAYIYSENIMIMHWYIVSIMHWNLCLKWQRIFIPYGKLISLDVFYWDTCVFSSRCVSNLFKVCCLQRLLLVNSMNK